MPIDDNWPQPCGSDANLEQILHSAFSTTAPPTRVAVAVSGGSDSLAVLHLMAGVASSRGFALWAVTVDHGLRAEAAEEAAWVGQVCAGLGVPHQILTWQHGAIAGNLMDAARQARYGLMADWAQAAGISNIFLGHTADDQAETFLMELARTAGLDGLVGMQDHWDRGGVRFSRPFLQVPRAELRAYLTRRGGTWIDDPSNDNDRFARVKARKALSALKPLGITVERLSGVMANLRDAQAVVVTATSDAVRKICSEQSGEVIFDRAEWNSAAAEVQRRLLIAALRWISGAGYAPRGSGVIRVMRAIAEGQDATLAGCRIRVSATSFRVVREPSAVAGVVSAPGALWDGRWRVGGPFGAGHVVRALGAEGLRQCKGWKSTGYSRDSLLVSPAVWYDEALIAAPVAGFEAGFCARIVAPFTHFVLSH